MDGKRLIEKIKLRNILSFGDKGEEIELQPLNIIIGQNGSGKSNLIDVFQLLRSLPNDRGVPTLIRENGGIEEWIWKGKKKDYYAEIQIVIPAFDKVRNLEEQPKLKYSIKIAQNSFRTDLIEEILEEEEKRFENSQEKIWFIKSKDRDYHIQGYPSMVSIRSGTLDIGESVLSEVKDYATYNTISRFGNLLKNTKIFSEINTNRSSRDSEVRQSQYTDLPTDFLEEDASNLFLILNDLEYKITKRDIIVDLQKFNFQFDDYSIRVSSGRVEFFVHEDGRKIPSTRLSDGTLRYLCLLAILCHPEPPPLICIEEPETGLHPDILPTIAELMKEASQRTQLIVTTHSDILVSAFSDTPEAVLVCEKDEDGTHFKRLEEDKLKNWLAEYSLGDLWLKGEIGGTRW
jgi:predicted ATPase